MFKTEKYNLSAYNLSQYQLLLLFIIIIIFFCSNQAMSIKNK